MGNWYTFGMDELIKKIVEKVFRSIPTTVEEIKGKGKNNLVFKITVNDNPVILRLSNRDKTLELYQKEKWCADVVKNAGIPTPKIIEVGIVDGYAFSFQEFVEGIQRNDAPQELARIWFTLGQYASAIHKISAPDLRLDYGKFVSDIFENDYFIIQGVFSEELSEKIKNRLKEVCHWKFPPTLCHGNLHPSNVLIDQAGVIHIIDWETATGNRTPQSELAEIYTWNNGKENVLRFIEGYGLKEDEVKNMMRDIQTLILLRLVSVIVRKMPRDNNWQSDTYIKETAVRLAEIADYQQDILFVKNL